MLFKKFKKNARAFFSRSMWKKKAVWLSSDFPDYAVLRDGKLQLTKFNLEVPENKLEYILDGFDLLRDLYEIGGFEFKLENEMLTATNQMICLDIQTVEELFILREVFVKEDYNFVTNCDVVVIDIGMNIGIASLYFALRKNVLHVYGYEPFAPTFQQCIRNLALNQRLSSKITASNFGLSDYGKTIEVDYDADHKGQVGIHGISLIKSHINHTSKERIELKSILSELEHIIGKHPGIDIVCKIDCEGAEYELFRSFSEHGIPGPVRIIMMEWHECGSPEILLTFLLNNGFKAVKRSSAKKHVGMIYAFR